MIVASGEPHDSAERWCEGCRAPARLVKITDAAALLRARADAVLHWATQAGLHVSEERGAVYICLNSLTRNGAAGAAMKTIWQD